MVIKRGQIWWADLPDPRESEPGYRRPVIIVQSDDFNRSLIQTVIAVVVTSNLKLTQAPGNVFLPVKKTGLAKDCVANVSQMITLDKKFLTEHIATLPRQFFIEIEKGLKLALSL